MALPLDGVRVADFSWVVAGPLTGRWLADYGADVIKVESMAKIDGLRKGPPYQGGKFHINGSAYYAAANTGKRCILLNLNRPRGLEAAKRLIQWADVVIENFTPGQMAKWGLDYESLREIKPEIIMISLSIQGQTGPHRLLPGLGPMLAGLAGLGHLTGWEDGPPSGVSVVYTDAASPQFASLALAAALEYRARTGKGQYIDLSQFETSVWLLGAAMLDWTVNGRNQGRVGNQLTGGDVPIAAPHGAYPCIGDDKWCALAVFSDEQWQAFGRVIGSPAWTQDARFASHEARRRNTQALDELVGRWTRQFAADEVMRRMQAAGVPAGVVHDQRGLYEDPQLNALDHYVWLDHLDMGRYHTERLAPRLSRTPAQIRRPAPLIGEHSEEVCKQVLGYSDAEYDAMLAEGAVELWETPRE